MKKWNGNSFSKTKLATAVAVVSLGLLAGGCGSDGDRSTSVGDSGSVTQIQARGSVTGQVQDTNGNPITGATVYLNDQETTTNAGGQYTFNNVQVTNVAGADANTTLTALVVRVVPPAGYVGATVNVTPQAQVDANDSGNAVASTDVNTANMFFDDFLAQAGTAVLPATNAVVTGTLRLAATGEPLPSQSIFLDFAGVYGVNAEVAQNGVTTSYAFDSITAVTDTDGKFTVTGVPADSALNLIVQGFYVTSITNVGSGAASGTIADAAPPVGCAGGQLNACVIGTANESAAVVLGSVSVLPILSSDVIPPVVASVNTVRHEFSATQGALPTANKTGGSGNPVGVLDDDEVDSVTLQFSESIKSIQDENSIYIWDSTAGAYLTGFTATLSSDGRSMTIAFATAFDKVIPHFLEISLLRDDFLDQAGNQIAEGSTLVGAGLTVANSPAGSGVGPSVLDDISFDNLPNIGKLGILNVELCTFAEASLVAGAVADLTQIVRPESAVEETTASSTSVSLYDAENGVLAGTIVEQLNQPEYDANENPADRLSAVTAAVNIASGVTVTNGVARVKFTAPQAAQLVITATGSRTSSTDPVKVTLSNANATLLGLAGGNGTDTLTLTGVPEGTVVEVVIGDAAAGLGDTAVADVTTVSVSSTDDLGNGAQTASLVLRDLIEPTVAVQSAHGLTSVLGGSSGNDFGDGAEISENIAGSAGGLAYPVNAGMFTEFRSDATQRVSERFVAASGANFGGSSVQAIDADTVDALAADTVEIVYDATGYANATRDVEVGFAVSENLASATLTYTGTASITNVEVHNDVGTSVFSNAFAAKPDIINFDVNNLETFAADATTTSTLSMLGSTDLAGNASSSAAAPALIITDWLPPLVARAAFTADGLIVDFNEAIDADEGSPTIHLGVGAGQPNYVIDVDVDNDDAGCSTGEDQPVLSNSNTRLTVPFCYLGRGATNGFVTVGGVATNVSYNTLFNIGGNSFLGAYDEVTAYSALAPHTAGDQPRHTSIMWSSIRDTRAGHRSDTTGGNSWLNTVPRDAADPNAAETNTLTWTGLGSNGNADGASDFNAGTQPSGNSPVFALIDGIGTFDITVDNSGFNDNDNSHEVLFSFSHPVLIGSTQAYDVNGNAVLDGANSADDRPVLGAATTVVVPNFTGDDNGTINTIECGQFFGGGAGAGIDDLSGANDYDLQACAVTFNETSTSSTTTGLTTRGFSLTFTTAGAVVPGVGGDRLSLAGEFVSAITLGIGAASEVLSTN